MGALLRLLPGGSRPGESACGVAQWLRLRRHTIAMAGLLSFAAPVTFFTGAVSVMRAPTAMHVIALGSWWLLYAIELWALLLLSGHICRRLWPASRRGTTLAFVVLCSSAAAALVTLSTSGRARILIEQGVVASAVTMHLVAFTLSLTMALLYHSYLLRSWIHDAAASRLNVAQVAQRAVERRMLQARLQAVQARVDPLLLFEMLEAVRQCYESDVARAERLLDELIAFLRAALPRLRVESSNVTREVGLAQVCVRLRALARAADFELTVKLAAEVRYARFPPGVLLPLLDDALRKIAGPCSLSASKMNGRSRLVLTLPARPSAQTLEQVRALLAEVHGNEAELVVEDAPLPPGANVIVDVPHESA